MDINSDNILLTAVFNTPQPGAPESSVFLTSKIKNSSARYYVNSNGVLIDSDSTKPQGTELNTKMFDAIDIEWGPYSFDGGQTVIRDTQDVISYIVTSYNAAKNYAIKAISDAKPNTANISYSVTKRAAGVYLQDLTLRDIFAYMSIQDCDKDKVSSFYTYKDAVTDKAVHIYGSYFANSDAISNVLDNSKLIDLIYTVYEYNTLENAQTSNPQTDDWNQTIKAGNWNIGSSNIWLDADLRNYDVKNLIDSLDYECFGTHAPYAEQRFPQTSLPPQSSLPPTHLEKISHVLAEYLYSHCITIQDGWSSAVNYDSTTAGYLPTVLDTATSISNAYTAALNYTDTMYNNLLGENASKVSGAVNTINEISYILDKITDGDKSGVSLTYNIYELGNQLSSAKNFWGSL